MVLDNLNVVDDRDDRRRLVDDADIGEHAPFEIEEAVALAEAHAVGETAEAPVTKESKRPRPATSDRVIGLPKCSSPSSQAANSSWPAGTIDGSSSRKPR